ncbi:MAG: hypothetical protein AAGI38_09895 [Bacteroidota bacterium]
MTLKELKRHLSGPKMQVVVMDRAGKVIDSCDTLFEIRGLRYSVWEVFPFLTSPLNAADELIGTHESHQFYAVELVQEGVSIYCDCELARHPEEEDHLVWLILDQDRIYRELQVIQQERNLYLLRLEQLEAVFSGKSVPPN